MPAAPAMPPTSTPPKMPAGSAEPPNGAALDISRHSQTK
jgi:hypothetical protein